MTNLRPNIRPPRYKVGDLVCHLKVLERLGRKNHPEYLMHYYKCMCIKCEKEIEYSQKELRAIERRNVDGRCMFCKDKRKSNKTEPIPKELMNLAMRAWK